MFFYFDFAQYRRLLSLAWRESNPRARRHSLRVLLLAVPSVALFHAVCFFLDAVFFPALWRTRVVAPVFVVGHARSGTTLVHRLMGGDAERFSSFLLWELYFPSLLQKKVIRFGARLDARWLGGVLGQRVRAWEERRYGPMKHVHEMSLTQPEEDDLVFYWSCASGFWITRMPYMGDLDFFYVDRWPEPKRRRLMRFYRDCVRRQILLNGGSRTHLSKNPIFAGRVASLIETFPDAKFVVPMRHPGETIPSLLKLMRLGWRGLDWDEARIRRCLSILAEQSFDTYRLPLEVLAAHPEVPRAIVDYRDVLADPAGAIERIYSQLGLTMTDAYRGRLKGEGTRARQHVSDHRYSLAEFGLEADVIEQRLADLFDRFEWNTVVSAPVDTAEERA
jgi:hypothetical protein